MLSRSSVGPVMMYTIINVGQGIGTTGAVAYIIDVHRKNAAECFALINFVKNIILYGFARFANSWVENMVVIKFLLNMLRGSPFFLREYCGLLEFLLGYLPFVY